MKILKSFIYTVFLAILLISPLFSLAAKPTQKAKLLHSLLILPVPNPRKTANFYSKKLGFRTVEYLGTKEPHICLYRDDVEIILTKSKLPTIKPNRILYGYGYDGYFTTMDVKSVYKEFQRKSVKIAKPLRVTDYSNKEFVLEDIDGRWIAIGLKQK